MRRIHFYLFPCSRGILLENLRISLGSQIRTKHHAAPAEPRHKFTSVHRSFHAALQTGRGRRSTYSMKGGEFDMMIVTTES